MLIPIEKTKKVEAWVSSHKWSSFFLSPIALAFFYGIFLFLYELKFFRDLIPPVHPVLIGWAMVQVVYHFVLRDQWRKLPLFGWVVAFAFFAGVTSLITLEAGIVQNIKVWIMVVFPFLLFYPLCFRVNREERRKALLIGMGGGAFVVFLASAAAIVLYLMRFSETVTFMGMEELVGYRFYNAQNADSGILLYGLYKDTNHAAIYSLIFAVYSVALFGVCKKGIFSKKWINKAGMVFAALNFAVQILYFPLANSRGGWLSLAVGAAFGFFFYMYRCCSASLKKVWRSAVSMIATVLCVVLLFGILVGARNGLSRLSLTIDNASHQQSTVPSTPQKPQQGDLGETTPEDSPEATLPKEEEPSIQPDHFDKNDSTFDGGRIDIWKEALALFAEYPLFGTTPGNNQYFALKHFDQGTLIYGKAIHNSYLDLLVDYGIVGFVVMMLFCAQSVALVLRGFFCKKPDGTYCLVFGCVAAVAVASLLLSCIFINTTAMYFALLIMLGYLLAEADPPEEEGAPKQVTLRYLLSLLRRKLIHGFMLLCRICPIQKNKIVVVNYYGNGFGDNGKAIVLSLLEKNKNLDIVWAARPEIEKKLPSFVRYVEFRSLKFYWESATAKVWLDNSRKGADMLKRKGQYYIQCWHGSIGLKQVEKDAEEALSIGYIDDAKNDSKMADLIIAGCGYFTECCRRAFWYDGEILECGSPRLDVMFKATEETKCAAKESLGIPADKKVILYAPTFRVDGNTDCYNIDFARVLEAMNQKTGEEWVFAIRLHPNVAKKANFIQYSDTVFDGTSFADLYELIPAVDAVISDYSSLSFDAAVINKPVFIYANDLEAYIADRDIAFSFSELPFPFAETNDALIQNMLKFDRNAYEQEVARFFERVASFEKGTASDAVCDRILEVMNLG